MRNLDAWYDHVEVDGFSVWSKRREASKRLGKAEAREATEDRREGADPGHVRAFSKRGRRGRR